MSPSTAPLHRKTSQRCLHRACSQTARIPVASGTRHRTSRLGERCSAAHRYRELMAAILRLKVRGFMCPASTCSRSWDTQSWQNAALISRRCRCGVIAIPPTRELHLADLALVASSVGEVCTARDSARCTACNAKRLIKPLEQRVAPEDGSGCCCVKHAADKGKRLCLVHADKNRRQQTCSQICSHRETPCGVIRWRSLPAESF